MTTTSTGLTVPAGSDEFDPQGDMVALASSTTGRIVVPVANVSERDALAGTLSPSASEPLTVFRADAAIGRQIEYTTDGAIWQAVQAPTDSGWLSIAGSVQNSWTAPGGLNVRQIGNQVHIVGTLQKATATGGYEVAASIGSTVAKPTTSVALGLATGSGAALRAAYIDDLGQVQIFSSGASAAYVRLSGTYLTD